MVRIPRLLIAGTHSGVGKTTVAIGLMAAFAKRGDMVQPFKVGPDYLDPTYHAMATGRASRNLDTWMLNRRRIFELFQRASDGADRAIIEGVMGLFDGRAGTNERGSTAELAKQLKAPIILVVDASGMARSVAALVQGYHRFDPQLRIAGVIVNRVRERHFALLREALRRYTDVPALGYLPPEDELAIPERHLGLVPAREDVRMANVCGRMAERIGRSVDLERLVRIANAAPPLASAPWPSVRSAKRTRVSIGVAKDDAFHFYYQDNLDLLRSFGAELVEVSPLRDRRLPQGLDGLYLGGGFPELFAAALAKNLPFRRHLKRAVSTGLPTYAECGGLMYLTERLRDQRGRSHPMVGLLPGEVRMTDRLQHFGYATITPQRDTILARAGDPVKGHEFHYSTWTHEVPSRQAAYTVVNARNERRFEGMARGNLLASYIHVHFLANVRWAQGFVTSANRWTLRRAAELGAGTR